ncbi:MAG: inositol monophosphatase [Actinomycetota bacterium]
MSAEQHDGDDLALARDVSDSAAELALQFFRFGATARRKPDGSPVTEADLAVERLLRAEIGRARPSDAVLGEELGGEDGSGASTAAGDVRCWVLDPIDGTAHFARHRPEWRVHVALSVDGRIEVAVITAPARGLQWFAARGAGAFEAKWPDRERPARPLSVSDVGDLDQAIVASLRGTPRGLLPRRATRRRRRPNEPWCQGLIELVRGQAHGFLAEGCQVWDHAPWVLLVEEAGGCFDTRSGNRSLHALDRGGYYTTAALREPLLRSAGFGEPTHSLSDGAR